MGLIASQEKLEIANRARIDKNWSRQDPKLLLEATVGLETLKRFWRGKTPIKEDNFKEICRALGVDWKEIVDWGKSRKNRVEENEKICLKEDCDEMPDVLVFYGREKEIQDIKKSILDNRSRALVLCGQPGIGKTALAAKLAEKVKSDFECFCWRSLNYSSPPTLSELLSGLIKFLSSEENNSLPSNVDDLIKKLLQIFSNRRILLVIDSWEKILRVQNIKGCQTDYDKYSELLKQIAERRHKSYVIITTQEEPKELSLLKTRSSINLIQLTGLDFEAGLKILEERQLTFIPEQAKKLINRDYNGNPLELIHICEHIASVFAGSLTQYEINHTYLVPQSFQSAINEICKNLSDLEAQILQIIATESKPIEYEKLKLQILQNYSEVSNSSLQINLSLLLKRSLIQISSQGNKVLYYLQPTIGKCIIKIYNLTNH
ncbi:MAG: ATP-binding protein [Cyanobacteria bacterium P01_D01_bin.116]